MSTQAKLTVSSVVSVTDRVRLGRFVNVTLVTNAGLNIKLASVGSMNQTQLDRFPVGGELGNVNGPSMKVATFDVENVRLPVQAEAIVT